MNTLILTAMAAILVALGTWGIRHAPRLAPAALPGQERRHRARVLRRGGIACLVAATLLLAAGAHALLTAA
ncbi:hypothetical protein H0B56_13160 [Haloechinothrix sp. YIM 98757]|uniref:Uncharacterized protein n=1 Tax=Haloechinothrix aidingensis TaxID=2752311 RepID=A0A838AB77_9PSEU|nr:hypothetical protein [Haloechinothrix aidingensis]MBA0126493.1 hypothetical protein [Haloechinothrix aidingensis]